MSISLDTSALAPIVLALDSHPVGLSSPPFHNESNSSFRGVGGEPADLQALTKLSNDERV